MDPDMQLPLNLAMGQGFDRGGIIAKKYWHSASVAVGKPWLMQG
jgi:hypothetical protein